MRYIIGAALAVVLALGAAGCVSEDYATPAERAQLEQLDAQIEERLATLAGLEGEILGLREDAREVETEKGAAALMERLNELAAEYRSEREALLADQEEQGEVVRGIQDRTAGAAAEAVVPFLPAPLQPLAGPLALLAAGLAFKRPRRHLKNALASGAKLNIAEAVADVGRALGLKHTTEDPQQLIVAAESLARERGDDDLVAKIKALRSGSGGA